MDWPGSQVLWGQFWSAHQRFFKYLCVAAKVPGWWSWPRRTGTGQGELGWAGSPEKAEHGLCGEAGLSGS